MMYVPQPAMYFTKNASNHIYNRVDNRLYGLAKVDKCVSKVPGFYPARAHTHTHTHTHTPSLTHVPTSGTQKHQLLWFKAIHRLVCRGAIYIKTRVCCCLIRKLLRKVPAQAKVGGFRIFCWRDQTTVIIVAMSHNAIFQAWQIL